MNKYDLDKADKESEYLTSISDKYWHQSVILPLFIDKFVSSITSWIDDINTLEKCDHNTGKLSTKIDEIRDGFKKDITQLIYRTQLLCAVEEQVRVNVREKLDEIEDCITRYLSDKKEKTYNVMSRQFQKYSKNQNNFLCIN
ncbi:hypothetical protein QZJ86_04180 [Methylomonas montana]|uniref:hypothetical protein n=1 Tax=Methylomonas montana TaxID=3058963 RepID=UPI002658C2F1|nr:hypothetical protein [Methylomonas montana]WKJ91333.1 hypothetical protein QZJ86_04180 [Methylomonas montana]